MPTLAVWKFASCDGCQLSLLDCEDELLAIGDSIRIASFPEASSAIVDGPYDLSLVEGSVTTPDDIDRIRAIRAASTTLVTIGACATGGGIQALRNGADIEEYLSIVYAHPGYISTLATSTPIADHVDVDFELRGCPIDRRQLVEVVAAYLTGRPPRIASTSVCTECKARRVACVMVVDGAPCLGPVTHAGCGALCPSFRRGCYGCFGPAETADTATLDRRLDRLGLDERERERLWRGFSGWELGGPR
jgi:coenzyme F420-reducing hydrogenase gamma subunit